MDRLAVVASVRGGGIFLLISTVLLIAGILWPWGWVVGVALLLIGGPSDSEKNGYRF